MAYKKQLYLVDEYQTVDDFNSINSASDLDWAFKSQVAKFIKRFLKDPYRDADTEWIKKITGENHVNIKKKLSTLSKLI